MAEQGDQFKKLPEEDRMLLAGYIGLANLGQKMGGSDIKPMVGRTVGEVLVDAKAWQAKVKEQAAEQVKKDTEARVLRDKILAENKVLMDKLNESVTVAVTKKISIRRTTKSSAFTTS